MRVPAHSITTDIWDRNQFTRYVAIQIPVLDRHNIWLLQLHVFVSMQDTEWHWFVPESDHIAITQHSLHFVRGNRLNQSFIQMRPANKHTSTNKFSSSTFQHLKTAQKWPDIAFSEVLPASNEQNVLEVNGWLVINYYFSENLPFKNLTIMLSELQSANAENKF